MQNPLIAKLEHAVDFTDEDRAVLARVTRSTRQVEAHTTIAYEGERPESVHLIMTGLACRHKELPQGERQILAFLLPGDFCDLHIAILDAMDHSITTVSPCAVVDIPRETILDLTEKHPRIARALWWCTLVDEGTLRTWILGLGQRDANQRMAHLCCELLVRFQAIGRADLDGFELPLTQTELSEALGISPVHTNRTLQNLRDQGLINFDGKRMSLPDVVRLQSFCGFDPSYLHLTKRVDAHQQQRRAWQG